MDIHRLGGGRDAWDSDVYDGDREKGLTKTCGGFMKNVRRVFVFLSVFMSVMVCTAYASTSPQTMIYKADKALEQDPNDAKAHYNRGTAHYNLGDYETAVSDLTQSIRLESNAADAYFNRGLALRHQKKLNEAIRDFSKAIELYPKNSSYYFERCNARIASGDFDGAIRALQRSK